MARSTMNGCFDESFHTDKGWRDWDSDKNTKEDVSYIGDAWNWATIFSFYIWKNYNNSNSIILCGHYRGPKEGLHKT